MSGKTASSSPFMKMEDTVHPGKKMLIKPQDSIEERLENLTSMMYKISIQQEEGKKPFKPEVYPKRERGQRRQNFENRDKSRNNGRQRKISDKPRMDAEMVTEEVNKTLVEVAAEIEACKTLGEIIIIMVEAD